MPYSDAEMREIEKDPARLRGYFWRIAMNAQRMAAEKRDRARRGFAPDGSEPEVLDRWSAAILENIDALVETTVVRAAGQGVGVKNVEG